MYDLLRVCCVCQEIYGCVLVEMPDEYPKVSHGYCKPCSVKALEEVNSIIRREAA